MIVVSLVFVLGVVIGLAYLTARRILEAITPEIENLFNKGLEGTIEDQPSMPDTELQVLARQEQEFWRAVNSPADFPPPACTYPNCPCNKGGSS